MFEKALRMKLRFDSKLGQLSVEDLWDLPLTSTVGKTNLDDMARALALSLQHANIGSFVEADKRDGIEVMKLDIIKHIITVKIAERDALRAAAANKERKQQILAIIAGKETEQLASLPLDDLKKLAEAM